MDPQTKVAIVQAISAVLIAIIGLISGWFINDRARDRQPGSPSAAVIATNDKLMPENQALQAKVKELELKIKEWEEYSKQNMIEVHFGFLNIQPLSQFPTVKCKSLAQSASRKYQTGHQFDEDNAVAFDWGNHRARIDCTENEDYPTVIIVAGPNDGPSSLGIEDKVTMLKAAIGH